MGGLGNKELPLYSPFYYNGYRGVPGKKGYKGKAEMVQKMSAGDVAVILYNARAQDKEIK